MKLNPLHLLDGQNPRSKNECFSVLVILLECNELWKYFQTSAAGCFLKERPLQLRPRIKTSKAIQDIFICILCVNRVIITTFLASFQLILFLHHTTCASLSDHAAPRYFAIHCSAWAASIPGWFHFNSRWEARCFAAFTPTLRFCWALLVTAFGTQWNTQLCRALL